MIQVSHGTDGGMRVYRTSRDRRKAVSLLKHGGYNFFAGFRNGTQSHPAGLTYARLDWVGLFPHEQELDSATPTVRQPRLR